MHQRRMVPGICKITDSTQNLIGTISWLENDKEFKKIQNSEKKIQKKSKKNPKKFQKKSQNGTDF